MGSRQSTVLGLAAHLVLGSAVVSTACVPKTKSASNTKGIEMQPMPECPLPEPWTVCAPSSGQLTWQGRPYQNLACYHKDQASICTSDELTLNNAAHKPSAPDSVVDPNVAAEPISDGPGDPSRPDGVNGVDGGCRNTTETASRIQLPDGRFLVIHTGAEEPKICSEFLSSAAQ